MKTRLINNNYKGIQMDISSIKPALKKEDNKDCCGDCKNKGVACKNINFDEILNNHFLTSKN